MDNAMCPICCQIIKASKIFFDSNTKEYICHVNGCRFKQWCFGDDEISF